MLAPGLLERALHGGQPLHPGIPVDGDAQRPRRALEDGLHHVVRVPSVPEFDVKVESGVLAERVQEILGEGGVETAAKDGARIFTFGVGFDLDVSLLDKIAEVSGGTRDYVMPEEDIEIVTSRFFRKVDSPVLTDVSVEFGNGVYDVYPKKLPAMFAGSQLVAFGRFRDAGERVIQAGEPVLCDFGGTMIGDDGIGYCSDITRNIWTDDRPDREYLEAYAVLHEAQAAAVRAATVGTPCQDVDRAARQRIVDAGFGSYFVHRTGHGIGVEAHEDPYIVEGNTQPLAHGNAFSVEPGIYIEGKWGMRLEDIVAADDNGPDPLNCADHHLAVLG